MIKLIKQGDYKIVETWGETRILDLGSNGKFSWIFAKNIGEILVTTKKNFNNLYTLARGQFRLYEVRGEPNLTDLKHLELYVGEGSWQGYLLPTGLPNEKDIRNRIIPTPEIITQTSGLRLLS